MPNPVTKAISLNDVKNGNAVTRVSKVGEIETVAPPILNSSTGIDLDGRFDDLRYYSGDSGTDGAGGPTTITCVVWDYVDNGYWRSQSTDATHDPGSSNNYGSVSRSSEWIVGFDRN